MNLNMSWFHATRGQYFPDTKVVGIDLQGSLSDKKASFSTLIHETMHVYLCNKTEIGIFSQDIETHIHKIESLSDEDKKKIVRTIFIAQQSVQEGFATYYQYANLQHDYDPDGLNRWYAHLPDTYKAWLHPFMFLDKLTVKERNQISRLMGLSMNTHIRTDSVRLGLLDDVTKLEEYFSKPDNNPSYRLTQLLSYVRKYPGSLDISDEQLLKNCRLKIFEPISKSDIADFIFYLSSKTGDPIRIDADQVGDSPSFESIFNHVQNNSIVANLNLNLAKNAEFLYKTEDVVHYSDVTETIYISEVPEKSDEEVRFLKPRFDEEPEVSLVFQLKSGEKYMHITSKVMATKLINNDFKDAVLAIKFGDYNFEIDQIFWLEQSRPPDLVIYNHHWQMKLILEKVIEENPQVSIIYCNMGLVEENPHRSFFVSIKGKVALLGANFLLPIQADEVINVMKNNAVGDGKPFVVAHKNAINSHMIFWSGWDYRIDWVETMLNEDLILKQI